MNILITGANGYIGQRLLPALLEDGHFIYCSVRDKERFEQENDHAQMKVIEADFLAIKNADPFPADIDVAYYLIHSMTSGAGFEEKEAESARNFLSLVEKTNCRQIIYLTGIVNEDELSKHLSSRLHVEEILGNSNIPLTALRAGIIVGSGSASFEIMRGLVEKLPVMVAPIWLKTLCQPIAVRNVLQFLKGVALKEKYYNGNFDIGGNEVLSYKNMLLKFAKVRGLKRWIFVVPVMTPKLSSYWLYFITPTSFSLASSLVDSMKINVICRPNNLAEELGIELMSYEEAVELAFKKIEQEMVISSWKDSFSSSNYSINIMNAAQVPVHGCFKDIKWKSLNDRPTEKVLDNIWRIGGKKGWYYATHLWKIRGLMDKFFGGVGLRRGRTSESLLQPGDALDFWRVLVADKKSKRLLLYAEMKLPGEAWLEFRVMQKHNKLQLRQSATFRPKGVWGRVYWFLMLPFHYFIFNGMINNIVKVKG